MKNTYSRWQQRLLCSLLAGCLGAASCTEAPLPCSLVVMDAHGHPPESGHVFLAMPNSLSDPSTVLGWTVVSDTLHWDQLTGMVLPKDCQAFSDPKPVKRKTNLSGTWNVLGQEVPTSLQ